MDVTIENRNFLKSLINNIPLFIAIAYCLGTIKIYIFYQWFGFNILPFLDLSDLLTQTINDIMYIFEGGILIVTILSLINFVSPFKNSVLKIDNTQLEPKEKEVTPLKGKWSRRVFALILVCNEALYIYLNYKQYFTQINFRVVTITVILCVLTIQLIYFSTKFKNQTYRYSKEFVVYISLFIIYISYVESIRANYLLYMLPSGTVLTTANENIKTSNSLIYLGTTSKYLFLYEVQNKAVEVYPMSDIKKLVIKD